MYQQPHPRRVKPQATPLTAVTLVCTSHDGLATLASQINAFLPVSNKRWTVERACEHGLLHLLRRLVSEANADTHQKPQLYRSHVFSRALAHAVTHGNDIALIECLQTYCPDGFASLGMEAAARVGKLSVMQWLETHFGPHITWSSRFAEAAASNGHLDVLQWLATKFRPIPDRFCNILKAAVASGSLPSVQFLFEQAERDGTQLAVYNYRVVLDAACAAGHINIVTYLLDDRDFRAINPTQCIRKAVASGNLELAQWLHAQGYRDLDSQDIETVVRSGDVDVVRWMFEHDPTTRDPLNYFFHAAVGKANYAIAQALYAIRPELFSAKLVRAQLAHAAAIGDLAYIQWLLALASDRSASPGFDVKQLYACIIAAAEHGHMDTVQYLFATLGAQADDRVRTEEEAVRLAVHHGHFEIVKWLHANRTSATRPNYMIHAIEAHGSLELVQWMLQNAACANTPNSIVQHAGQSGDLATLQWMDAHFSWGRKGQYTHTIKVAVQYNHVHIVQWFHEQGFQGWNADCMDSARSLEMVEWFHNNRTEDCTTALMDNAAARGDFDTLLFLHEHRSEGCTATAAALAQMHDHHLIAQWLFRTFPTVVTTADVQANMRHVPPDTCHLRKCCFGLHSSRSTLRCTTASK